jgi:hypothetical protein
MVILKELGLSLGAHSQVLRTQCVQVRTHIYTHICTHGYMAHRMSLQDVKTSLTVVLTFELVLKEGRTVCQAAQLEGMCL